MRTSLRNAGLALAVLGWASFASAVPVVETFESFASGTIITNQLPGLLVTAGNGGNAKIATASNPVVPGEPQGIYNDAPGVFSTGFEFPLIFDFVDTGLSIGAIVDFGVVGDGLKLTAYDGVGGTGNVLGTATTLSEVFIGINVPGIKSAVFEKIGPNSPSWLLDNLTYEVSSTTVPEPGSLVLLGSGVLALARRRRTRA